MQQLDALPSGTSAPNTVITEYAVHKLGLAVTPSDWLIQTAHPLSEAQIASARQAAAAAGMSIETKSQAPTSAEVVNWATAAGILLALGILAMTVGLIRAETARDLRTLIATGAAGPTRRTITAATAGTLALLGGVLGTISGYVAAIAWFRSEDGGNGLSSLSAVPTVNLLIILIGMPLAAAAAGWLLSGRQPPSIAHQPIE
jgi:putative ABC transport system permease protein